MLNPDSNQRQRIITRRILSELKGYFEAHNKGIEMKILSCKYARALNECGGFPEVIEAMRLAGEIDVQVLVGGARVVSLAQPKEMDDSAQWY